ncbi:MAG: hypothetical protein JW995_10635 [Melioribacteraceae bacterium]|nr:hypothetical protein [Melioribacteraceae bacterium]
MKEEHLTTVKTARFFSIGEPSFNTNSIWFVYHGYAQLAKEFLDTFSEFENEKLIIVAPEGLNRFYKKGFFGEVGASWMTKEDRESEIKDHKTFINNLYHKITAGLNTSRISCNFLGFSQGAETAFRIFTDNKFIIDNLIMWAGVPPGDSDYKKASILSVSTRIKFVFGMDDRLLNRDIQDKALTKLGEHKVKYETGYYDGGHEINPVLISRLNIFN